MARRYYGTDAPRSAGPHPDPMTATPGSAEQPDRMEKLLARLDAGARHQDYPEAFGESWPQLCQDAASAIRRLAAKPAEEGWQDISTAPQDGREVLLQVKLRAGIPGKCLVGHYMPGGHCISDHPPIDSGWYFWNGCMFDRAADPVLWMALPLSTPGQPKP